MMEIMITHIEIVFIALLLAMASAFVSMKYIEKRDRTYMGPWYIILPQVGDEKGMYTRTWYTLTALFGLKKDEQIYFVAETDHSGKPLISGNDYQIKGGGFECRWWNITVYGQDGYLLGNPENRYSFSNFDILKRNDIHYTIHLSSDKKDGNWLFSGKKGEKFSIMLRINHPTKDMVANPGGIVLPLIIKENGNA
ncbi:MAG: DUF1214 domain-containing protein [Proteobacteria bacterium]|nr:DUF1214 domain-containing protein [Pseudomonadota bacterium]